MSQLRVLIVGASIAGPMTAYWFAKAGAQVTVIERYPSLRKAGQGIDIRTTGVTVMRKIPGMEASVRSKTTQMEGMCWVRDDGTPYGKIKPTGNPDQQSLISEYEIFRGDLSKILFDLTLKYSDRIKYVFGEQVASMQQSGDDDPVKVEFLNGYPTSNYDLVVACDGSTSRTRAMGFSCSVRDHIQPANVWGAYFSIKQTLLEKGSKDAHAISGIGGRFLGLMNDPAGGTRVGLMCVQPSKESDSTLAFREAMKEGEDALRQYIAKKYKGMGWKTDEVVDAMRESTDFYASEVVQVKVPSLHQGRFVLVGDAGYGPGPTGTGTTLAMTGAYILAGEVCNHQGNLAAGLRAYEERMKPIINDMQKVPPFVSTILAPQTAWGIWLRNNIFAFIAWINLIGFIERLSFGSATATDKYNLPDYHWVA